MQTVAFTHLAPSADALWSGLMGGTVRTSALIARQTDEVQQQIRAAFERIVEPFSVGTALEIPVSVKLASGRKPSA